MPRPQLALNLFWRTFAWLALLLAGAVLAWQYTFKLLEAQPRALEAAEQLAGLVKLSRIAQLDRLAERLGERPVICCPQVTLEPDHLNHRNTPVAPRGWHRVRRWPGRRWRPRRHNRVR